MKVLQCHNYHKKTGGEDLSVDDEARLLRDRGHEVVQFGVNNTQFGDSGVWFAPWRLLWNRRSLRDVRSLVRSETPDILHVTNTFPLISHSIYYANSGTQVPIVQSVRNYRFGCPVGSFTRQGRICEDCITRRVTWPCVVHRCYKDQYRYSLAAASISTFARCLRIWERRVDAFIALTPIVKEKMVAAGLPVDRIFIKPNLVHDSTEPVASPDNYAIYAGRLDPVKGVRTLLRAWQGVSRSLRLVIVGQGELEDEVRQQCAADPRIEWRGQMDPAQVLELIRHAQLVIFPSEWYETFGRTILEAFSRGVPVVASRLGAMAQLVEHGTDGFFFTPGNSDELASAVNRYLAMDTHAQQEMRFNARRAYVRMGTPEANYQILMDVYRAAIARRQQKSA